MSAKLRSRSYDGSPAGIITAEVVNWTGKALSAPRSRLGQLIRREEAERTGIYILIGPDPDRTTGLKAYVGEGDSIGKRLRRHEADEDMDFFDRVAFVVSKDDNLTKAHARVLESHVIQLSKEAGTVALANSTEPDFTRLPEADRADMAFFIEQLGTVLPILGFDLFRPGHAPARRAQRSSKSGRCHRAPLLVVRSLFEAAQAIIRERSHELSDEEVW